MRISIVGFQPVRDMKGVRHPVDGAAAIEGEAAIIIWHDIIEPAMDADNRHAGIPKPASIENTAPKVYNRCYLPRLDRVGSLRASSGFADQLFSISASLA